MKPVDITNTPSNPMLVNDLERLLEEAKSGELQGIAYICSYNDQCVSHGWALNTIRNHMRLLGASTFLHNEIVTNESFRDENSVLNQNFERY